MRSVDASLPKVEVWRSVTRPRPSLWEVSTITAAGVVNKDDTECAEEGVEVLSMCGVSFRMVSLAVDNLTSEVDRMVSVMPLLYRYEFRVFVEIVGTV